MSHRIFVNQLNESYRAITQNAKGSEYGLGVTSTLTQDIEQELQTNELYYTTADLQEKKRKLQIVLDSFTDPRFFGDGAVKIDKVEKYINDLQLEAQRIVANNNFENLATAGVVGTAGVIGTTAFSGATQLATINNALVGLNPANANLVTSLPIQVGLKVVARIAGVAAVVVAGIKLAAQRRQEGREDNAAPWKMTQRDFPNITSQAYANSSNRRSIERLYDSRREIDLATKSKQVPTQQAIALLVRECLADALFCTSNPSGNATTPSSHPGPGGNGTAEGWVNKDALAKHFPFTFVNTGPDLNERTYVNAVIYLQNYITLIDNILELQTSSLSRTPDLETSSITVPIRISLSTANVNLFDALKLTAEQVVAEKVLTYLDESREFKTLLNAKNDDQYLAYSWRSSPSKQNAIQFKLDRPLSTNIEIFDNLFVSRELAKSVIDVIEFEPARPKDTTPYLRPRNTSIKYIPNTAKSTNATLDSLGLSTGSTGVLSNNSISYGDQVFRRWYTSDFNSSELNIDFSNYKNFVKYGSAYARLSSFSEKLSNIEQLTSASSYASVSSSVVFVSAKAIEKETIIRNFDPYEQYLYFSTEVIPYSASIDEELEYNPNGTWPKQTDGTPYPVSHPSASTWFTLQSGIAQRYDESNQDYLIRHLPRHIQEDVESIDFLTFVGMYGHVMDNLKVYIDQYPYIYSTNPDPYSELTMDQVYEVASSFGLTLPNAYSLESLQSIIADSSSRASVSETWKRFLHNNILLAKTKGSRTALDILLNTYGINSPTLQVKESAYPSSGNYIKSEEYVYGLAFTSSVASRIQVPFVSASIIGSTLQVRFVPTLRVSSSIISGDDKWAIDLVPHPSSSQKESYGRLQFVSGSNRLVIATSSYFPLFSDDYTNIMLRSQSGDFTIVQTDGDQILYQESASVDLSAVWNNTQFVHVGGSGSIKYANFGGIVDELRLWKDNISNDNFISQVYDPGSYYGSNYTSSYENLYVSLPFSQPQSSITQSFISNESPYRYLSTIPIVSASGFTTASYTRLVRTVKQFTPIVGSTIYTNKKINVASPPTFDQRFVDVNGVKTLKTYTSIKQLDDKVYTAGQNLVSFAISPTDFINQNILRTMGVVDVNNIIGTPRTISDVSYTSLTEIYRNYLQLYHKTINPNQYIRFFRDLIKAPSEVVDTLVPARTKLANGIVIESSILDRNKTYVQKSIKVDGSGTKTFSDFVSGSGSIPPTDVGAYPFNTLINIPQEITSLGDTLIINGILDVGTDELRMITSTDISKLPNYRKVTQTINGSTFTASILDNRSSFNYLESNTLSGLPLTYVTSSGYARNPYLGIPNRLDSEQNTLIPFYDIRPKSDFSDFGTTTYFHKNNGQYYIEFLTQYKEPYLLKLDTNLQSNIDPVYARITVLSTGSLVSYPGRYSSTIPITSYASASNTTGTVRTANIFSIININGTSGLRLRLYNTAAARDADVTRSFAETPTIDKEVLFDGILEGNSDVFPYTIIQTTDSIIYYTIQNTTGTTITSDIILNYFAYEPANSLPLGYLPRHYKFTRENNTALRRRNYLGCGDKIGILSSAFPDGFLTRPEYGDFGCPWSPCPPFKTEPAP